MSSPGAGGFGQSVRWQVRLSTFGGSIESAEMDMGGAAITAAPA